MLLETAIPKCILEKFNINVSHNILPQGKKWAINLMSYEKVDPQEIYDALAKYGLECAVKIEGDSDGNS